MGKHTPNKAKEKGSLNHIHKEIQLPFKQRIHLVGPCSVRLTSDPRPVRPRRWAATTFILGMRRLTTFISAIRGMDQRASLLGARTLLTRGAPGLTTRSKKLLVTSRKRYKQLRQNSIVVQIIDDSSCNPLFFHRIWNMQTQGGMAPCFFFSFLCAHH